VRALLGLVVLTTLCIETGNAAVIRISPRNLNGTRIGLANAQFVATLSGGGRQIVASFAGGRDTSTGGEVAVSLRPDPANANESLFEITLNEGNFPDLANGVERNNALTIELLLVADGVQRVSPAALQNVIPRDTQTFVLAFPKFGETQDCVQDTYYSAPCGHHRIGRCRWRR
jgi:hypothetical protein